MLTTNRTTHWRGCCCCCCCWWWCWCWCCGVGICTGGGIVCCCRCCWSFAVLSGSLSSFESEPLASLTNLASSLTTSAPNISSRRDPSMRKSGMFPPLSACFNKCMNTQKSPKLNLILRMYNSRSTCSRASHSANQFSSPWPQLARRQRREHSDRSKIFLSVCHAFFRAFEIVTIDVEWQIVFFIVNVLGNLRDGGGRSLWGTQRRRFVLVRGIVERMIHVDIINIVLVIGYLPGRFKFTKFVRKSVVTVVRANPSSRELKSPENSWLNASSSSSNAPLPVCSGSLNALSFVSSNLTLCFCSLSLIALLKSSKDCGFCEIGAKNLPPLQTRYRPQEAFSTTLRGFHLSRSTDRICRHRHHHPLLLVRMEQMCPRRNL